MKISILLEGKATLFANEKLQKKSCDFWAKHGKHRVSSFLNLHSSPIFLGSDLTRYDHSKDLQGGGTGACAEIRVRFWADFVIIKGQVGTQKNER